VLRTAKLSWSAAASGASRRPGIERANDQDRRWSCAELVKSDVVPSAKTESAPPGSSVRVKALATGQRMPD